MKHVFIVALLAQGACLSAEGGGAADTRDTANEVAAEVDTAEPAETIDPETTVADPDTAIIEPDTATDPDTAIIAHDTFAPDTLEPDTEVDEPEVIAAEPCEDDIRISVSEGRQVLPGTRLTLSIEGVASTTPVSWSVVAPPGSTGSFEPDQSAPFSSYGPTATGEYRFSVVIFNGSGARCSPPEYIVASGPSHGIFIEVAWHTPGDIDETDTGGDQYYYSAGSDVDLHLLHPRADGEYFDYSFDCFWDHREAEWGIFGSENDALLARDDTDGAGPEIAALRVPEPGARYAVGVHYWNDWGYGPSTATIRIFIDGELRDEWADVGLNNDDMWDSHFIDADGTVTRIGADGPQITPSYYSAP